MLQTARNTQRESGSSCKEDGSCYRLREIRNVKAEVPAKKTEVATDYAKYANVKAEVPAKKTEVATDCAKHRNVKAEVPAKKTEVATENVDNDRLF